MAATEPEDSDPALNPDLARGSTARLSQMGDDKIAQLCAKYDKANKARRRGEGQVAHMQGVARFTGSEMGPDAGAWWLAAQWLALRINAERAGAF